MEFGLTDTIDCTNINKPVEDVIRDMTDGAGVDFSFDCTGNPDIIYSAMDCANPVLKICSRFSGVNYNSTIELQSRMV